MSNFYARGWRVRHHPVDGLVLVGPGEQLLIGPLRTVCEVEAVLRLLACKPQILEVDAVTEGKFIARFGGRRKLRIASGCGAAELVAILSAAKDAQVFDDRDPRRRRFEIKGVIRDFSP
jgi:hypothetical protein